jgi:hypothetical protein
MFKRIGRKVKQELIFTHFDMDLIFLLYTASGMPLGNAGRFWKKKEKPLETRFFKRKFCLSQISN